MTVSRIDLNKFVDGTIEGICELTKDIYPDFDTSEVYGGVTKSSRERVESYCSEFLSEFGNVFETLTNVVHGVDMYQMGVNFALGLFGHGEGFDSFHQNFQNLYDRSVVGILMQPLTVACHLESVNEIYAYVESDYIHVEIPEHWNKVRSNWNSIGQILRHQKDSLFSVLAAILDACRRVKTPQRFAGV
jgi:hypothetical protein